MIDRSLDQLIAYALDKGLIDPLDKTFILNSLLDLIGKPDYQPDPDFQQTKLVLHDILRQITDYACQTNRIDDTPARRDLFDTALMGILTARPAKVAERFLKLEQQSCEAATDDFYRFCHDTNYIRRDRSARDLRWTTATEYGELDLTINLSKPEKDPRDIAAAGQAKSSAYPACVLCAENEGYAGRLDHPARQNLRILPIDILGEPWGFQYSPYVYYNEHCILLNRRHVPMVIDDSVFMKLFDFVRRFPHYFMGSNADLPIVGGSILSHEHFQGGHYRFAMARAPVERHFTIPEFEDIESGIVKWPMSVIRLRHPEPERLSQLACRILTCWRQYSDPSVSILAQSDGTPHNTITPIARHQQGAFELDLVLRNNRTSSRHPLGIFHPHAELHHIKKENIGLIEVMGLAVLPGRLAQEMKDIIDAVQRGGDIAKIPALASHADWVSSWLPQLSDRTEQALEDAIRREIGQVFLAVLHHAGVFKRTEQGQAAFDRLIEHL